MNQSILWVGLCDLSVLHSREKVSAGEDEK